MSILKKIHFLLLKLSQPKSKNEDIARKEFILNVLLIGTLFLAIVCTVAAALTDLFLSLQGKDGAGLPAFILTVIVIFFGVLFVLSKQGKSKLIIYVFIGIYFFLSVYTSYHWGVYVPQALLVFALSIVMSGILISARFAFIMTSLSAIIIFTLFKLQSNNIIRIDSSWRETRVDLGDIIVYIVTLFVIAIVSWLSNREIEKSLHRARRSEADLKKERDMLEVHVTERTKELRKTQYEKMRQMYRFAEFGRISSGLFHDITNYLTALSLNLEMAKGKEEVTITKNYLEQALNTSAKMETFIEAVQRQLKHQETKVAFSLVKEIGQVIQVLNYKAKKHQVEILFSPQNDITTYGNPLKFNQIITNLISNAIDAYLSSPENDFKKILLDVKKSDTQVIIIVQDWGCGINRENIAKIYDPFFTTKDYQRGTGIGLATTKEIVEKDFHGKIEVISEPAKGTTFTVLFQIKNPPLNYEKTS